MLCLVWPKLQGRTCPGSGSHKAEVCCVPATGPATCLPASCGEHIEMHTLKTHLLAGIELMAALPGQHRLAL